MFQTNPNSNSNFFTAISPSHLTQLIIIYGSMSYNITLPESVTLLAVYRGDTDAHRSPLTASCLRVKSSRR